MIRTTYLLKNSELVFDLIHVYASRSGATSTPAIFVNIFSDPLGLNLSPSFNCANARSIHCVVDDGMCGKIYIYFMHRNK